MHIALKSFAYVLGFTAGGLVYDVLIKREPKEPSFYVTEAIILFVIYGLMTVAIEALGR